jgi:hypothetical protein
MDRDERTADEIGRLQRRGIRVLNRRTIESYLLDDGVLRRFCESLRNPDVIEQLLAAKRAAIENSVANGGAADDLKRAAGDIYNAARRLFADVKLGSDARAFMRQYCAPLVPGTRDLYAELRNDVFGAANA